MITLPSPGGLKGLHKWRHFDTGYKHFEIDIVKADNEKQYNEDGVKIYKNMRDVIRRWPLTRIPLALFLSMTDLWTSAKLEADKVDQPVLGRFEIWNNY